MLRLTAFAIASAVFASSLAAQEEKREPAPITPPSTPAAPEPAAPDSPEEPASTPSAPAGTPLELVPGTPGTLLPGQPLDPIPLIPETPETTERPSGTALPQPGKKDKKDKTAAASDSLEELIRFRQARTRASKDPRVVGEWERAQAATTDLEKREALKSYYGLYYKRVIKSDPRVKKLATAAQQRALNRLSQTRIDPTLPLDPSERVRYEP